MLSEKRDMEAAKRSDLAIERTGPLLFGLYSLIALLGLALHPEGSIPAAQAAWYRKQAPRFVMS